MGAYGDRGGPFVFTYMAGGGGAVGDGIGLLKALTVDTVSILDCIRVDRSRGLSSLLLRGVRTLTTNRDKDSNRYLKDNSVIYPLAGRKMTRIRVCCDLPR